MIAKIVRITLLSTSLIACGCASPGDSVSAAKSQTAEQMAQSQKRSANFLIEASDKRRLVHEASKMAMEKGSTRAVRDNARQLVAEQESVLSDMEQVAKAEGVVLPTRLSVRSSDSLRVLRNFVGKRFDERYLAFVVDRQEADIKEFRKALEDTQNDYTPKVQLLAVDKVPRLESQLEKLRETEGYKERTSRAIPADRVRSY